MKKYLVVQVGCIECGVSSYPIGFFETIKEAEEAKKNHPSSWDTEGGESEIYIWDTTNIDDDYKKHWRN